MLPVRDSFQHQGDIQVESEGMEKDFYICGNQMRAEVAILVSERKKAIL